MSAASYQTSAKSRGRREDSFAERQSSSRPSSQASQRLSKISSRSIDEAPIPRSGPDSPHLFWQRNKAVDPSRPSQSILMSPKASVASVKPSQDDDATPVPISPTKSTKSLSSKRSADSTRGSKESIGFGMDNMKSSVSSNQGPAARGEPTRSDVSHRPPAPNSKSSNGTLSQAAVSQMQPKVSDASEEDTRSQNSVRDTSSRTSADVSSPKGSDVGAKKSMASGPTTHPDMEGQPYPYQPPQTSTPAISPPQSPRMYQQNPYGSPPPGALPLCLPAAHGAWWASSRWL